MPDISGRCMCGAVRWSHDGPVTRRLACHCTDCQRATSAPFTAFIGLEPAGLTWQGAPNHYESSPGTFRGFCPVCGTRLYFRSAKWPGEIHLHAATLADGHAYSPDRHVKCADSPGWLHLGDDLEKLDGFDAAPRKAE